MRATGKTIWRVEREEGTNWATPFIWEHDGRTEIVTTGTERDPLVRSRRQAAVGVSADVEHRDPDAVLEVRAALRRSGYVGDQVRPVYAIKPGASGDISLKPGETTNASIAWSLPQGGPYNRRRSSTATTTTRCSIAASSPATTRRPARRSTRKVRLDPTASGFTASPWAYNGKLFAMSEDGTPT